MRPQKNHRTRLHLSMDSSLKNTVLKAAAAGSHSVSTIVAQAIKDYLQKQSGPLLPKQEAVSPLPKVIRILREEVVIL